MQPGRDGGADRVRRRARPAQKGAAMESETTTHPVVWIVAPLVLAACWPLAQSLRHERLRPVAAYLLFTSVFALVSGLAFAVLLPLAGALLGVEALEGAGAAIVILALSVLPGLAAARWMVSLPQRRRMPK